MADEKLVYLPLDERPCNYDFPQLLIRDAGIQMVRPALDMMGRKKTPGDTKQLADWLEVECSNAYGAVVSLDTLLYGGIVPSRLHDLSEAEILGRLERLRTIKQNRPVLKLFAMHLIMRCPQYSSDDEEPGYYGQYGRDIFRKGYLSHKQELGIITEEEEQELADILANLPAEVERDYLERRAINRMANRKVLEYVEEGIIDFLVIPQDDSAPYGWTALDQQQVRQDMMSRNVELRALMYPGADEAGCTLTIRMIHEMNGEKPWIYPRFAGSGAPYITPLYEDRPLFESVTYHILAAGGQIAGSAQEADVILLINAPGAGMEEANSQPSPNASYQVLRNVVELVEYGHQMMNRYGKPVAVADVAYANGGDLQLLKLLRQKGMLFQLAGYAGWNTSSNTLGTVIAQGLLYHRYGSRQAHLDFLALRYTEDCGYCSVVRKELSGGVIQQIGCDYFEADGQRGRVAGMVQEKLEQFVQQYVNTDRVSVSVDEVYLPWNRMFEVGVSTVCTVNWLSNK
ncbi:DUF4127 family protein [Paenibacillus lemnae]|uniref:DUF4127 family protein n=1 Tax=Paenibacillus lemnae TaxID=1330551 RepID=UPI001FE69D35|nr:DUF4127 family protein [Paenibacillus lemnae]